MFKNACKPLCLAASTSRQSAFKSCISAQAARASRGMKTVATRGNGRNAMKKGSSSPKHDKSSGSFRTLPKSVVGKFQQEANALNDLPSFRKGVRPAEYTGAAVQFPVLEGILSKEFGLPRSVLFDFRLLSKPCAAIRQCAVDLCRRLDEISNQETRLVLTGAAGTGKSYALLQAVMYCCLSAKWLVLYIPRAHRLVDSSTAYLYDIRSQTFVQPQASSQILSRFYAVNKQIIDKLNLSSDLIFDKREPVKAGTPLSRLFQLAADDQHHSPEILTKVLEELGNQKEYPVLLAVDGLQALYGKTEYRDQHFSHIKSYHLSLPRLLLDYASGRRRLNRGAFVGALSTSLTQFPLSGELRTALKIGDPVGPYVKLDKNLLQYAMGLETMEIPRLQPDEAAAIFEIWLKDRALHSDALDELFLSKLSESRGNARDFVHGGIISSLY